MAAKRRQVTAKRITAWSFSRYNDYESCPRMAKHKYIDRMQDKPGKAMLRGGDIHKGLEAYTKGESDTIPDAKAMEGFVDDINGVREAAEAYIEEQWCLNSGWQPTGWFDDDAWCRIKVDAAVMASDHTKLYVIDYKTGRYRPYHEKQMDLYAIGGFTHFPEIDEVVAELWYVDEGDALTMEYTRDQLEALQKRWDKRVEPMLEDVEFRTTPGIYCNFCPAREVCEASQWKPKGT